MNEKELQDKIIQTMAEMNICDTTTDIIAKQKQLQNYMSKLHSAKSEKSINEGGGR